MVLVSPSLSRTAAAYFFFCIFLSHCLWFELQAAWNKWKSGYLLCSPGRTGSSDFQRVQRKPWYPWLSQPSRASCVPCGAGTACVWCNDVQVNGVTFSIVSQAGVLPYCLAPVLPPKSNGAKVHGKSLPGKLSLLPLQPDFSFICPLIQVQV